MEAIITTWTMTKDDAESDAGDDQMLPKIKPQVVFCEVEDGAVLLSAADEIYFGLNEVGARVWQMLPPHHTTIRQVCDSLMEEYPDAPAEDILTDVQELLQQLREHGLVHDAA